MSGALVTIKVDDRLLRDVLSKLTAAGQNLAPVLDEIGAYLVSETTRRFRDGVSPDGDKWIPSERASRGKGKGKTLVDRGHLRNSITHVVTGGQVTVGTSLPYAAIHQFGGQAGRGKKVTLPARPYLGINAEDEAAISSIVHGYLEQSLRGLQ